VDEAGVWTELGHAQLEAGAINDAIGSYLRSGDSSRYTDVIARSQEANAHGDLVKYLLMVRKKVKESKVGQKFFTRHDCNPK
jgi:clathrin heavy chain